MSASAGLSGAVGSSSGGDAVNVENAEVVAARDEEAVAAVAMKEKRRDRRHGGGGKMDREVLISKALSKLLRHRAEEAGIKLDEEGFAPLDKVLAHGPIKSLKTTFADIHSVVATNAKQRFLLKPNPQTNPSLFTASTDPADYLIRANQGHSIKLESASLMEPITLEAGNVPARVLHGTYFAAWAAIVASGGLMPMGRNHVHCSVGTPGEEGVVSGMRGNADLVIEIDVEKSLREAALEKEGEGTGIRWWRSDNGVVLTEGDERGVVSTRFFKRVTGRKVDVGVLWEDGEMRASLPEGLKMKGAPRGRGGGRGGGGRGGKRGSGQKPTSD